MIFDWSQYPNFTKQEFDCQETGENRMKPGFMAKLQTLRTAYDRPMVVTSGFRSKLHSIETKKTAPGPHTTGLACDIRVGPGEDVYDLIRLAFLLGFNGIGVSQKSGGPRFVHLDTCERRAVWSY